MNAKNATTAILQNADYTIELDTNEIVTLGPEMLSIVGGGDGMISLQ